MATTDNAYNPWNDWAVGIAFLKRLFEFYTFDV